jgi:hypothetical protein
VVLVGLDWLAVSLVLASCELVVEVVPFLLVVQSHRVLVVQVEVVTEEIKAYLQPLVQ